MEKGGEGMRNENIRFPYHYGQEADLYSFYRVPKLLFTDEEFDHLSTDAKLLYGILLDRMNLSRVNNWMDEDGRIYIYYTIESIMDALNCGNKKAGSLLAELDDKKGIGLITRYHQGLGKPDKIFVHKCVKTEPAMSRGHPQTCENDISGEVNSTFADMSEGRTNNTEYSNTDMNNTESIYPSEMGCDEKEQLYYRIEEVIKQNIDFDVLCMDHPYEKDALQEIVDIMIEVITSNKKSIVISGEEKPIAIVKSRFMKLNIEHIRYVLGCLQNNTTNIKNIKQYLITTLYNAPMTISHYYRQRVNHDLYG